VRGVGRPLADGLDVAAGATHANLRRVLIVGSSNAGKTTLGDRLATRLGVPFFELDALHWDRDWTPVADEVFRARVEQALADAGDGWVIDGNYEGKLGDSLWRQADTAVFLDLPLSVLLYRTIRRTVVRSVRKVELYSGNREHLRYLVQKDSLIWFTLRHYTDKRARWSARIDDPAYSHLHKVRLTSGRDTNRWLQET
jgi:adenylate kinase family enzyme